MLTVDGRCFCDRCEARTKDIYRMIGDCSNCLFGPILVLYRAGDPAVVQDCPLCHCFNTVKVHRRANDDEFPEAKTP